MPTLDFSVFLTTQGWLELLTLSMLEIVLGIDNIIMISILSGTLPPHQQKLGRRLGLAFALITRIMLLFSLSWMMHLTEPLFHLFTKAITGRDLVLIIGGLFLLYKAGMEIYERVEMLEEKAEASGKAKVVRSLLNVVAQIGILDIVFSLDSVITAVGMSDHLAVMVLAVMVAVFVMLLASEAISAFVDKHTTVKILALSFLLLVGLMLVVDGFGLHVSKNYLYMAMGFSVLVELLHMRMRKNAERLKGH